MLMPSVKLLAHIWILVFIKVMIREGQALPFMLYEWQNLPRSLAVIENK